jgi:regulator of sigma E protease
MDIFSIAQFGGSLTWTLLAFIVALSVIVAIHEYGHYIVGRWCGIKADVFSIGFGPVLAKRMDKHGTQWQLAAIPLGGYVKFRGDANAASVGADGTLQEMTPEERETTMTGAALWKRAATVVAGPVFNFILSILIFGTFAMVGGRPSDAPVVGPLAELPPEVVFLEPGDRITALNGEAVETRDQLRTLAGEITNSELVTYSIERDGEALEVEAAAPFLPLASSVTPNDAAWDVGLRAGDYIRTINGERMTTFRDMQLMVNGSDGATLEVTFWRPGEAEEYTATLSPRRRDLPLPEGGFETRWLMGLSGGLVFEPAETEAVGPGASLWAGVEQTGLIIRTSLSALGHIIVGQISTCNLSGPIGIAETSSAAATLGLSNFIWFIAVLSTAVGMLNLFPIPVLDGGHLVFHAYEAVRGQPPSDRAVRLLMTVGVGLMGALMVFALFNDIFCP